MEELAGQGKTMGLSLGGWDLCESGDWQGEGGVVGGDWSEVGWEQGLFSVGARVSREQGVVG